MLRTVAIVLTATIGLGSLCNAQGKPGQVPKGVGALDLADEPFRLDSVGLSIRLPVGATVESTRLAGRQSVQVTPANGAWVMNVQTPQTANENATIADALKQTLDLIKGSYGVVDPDQSVVLETQAKILEQIDSLDLPGGKAARLYVSLPRAGNMGSDKSRLVKGYTIFKPGPKQYVVFELVTPEKTFTQNRGAYETSVGTALFVDSNALMLGRGAAVKAGTAFVTQLSSDDYQRAFGEGEQWYRLYRPAKTGAPMDADELGYRGVKFWRGQRGEVNPGKAKSQWSRADQQEGYLCQVRGRIVVEGGMGDTMGVYFMTLDRNEEMWSVTTAFKDAAGKVIAQASETGARLGDDVTVVKEESGRPPTHVKPPIIGEGYVSQFETYLLPRMMVQKDVRAELGFYAYQSNPSNTISFRRESAQKEGSLWTVTTTVREDMPPQVSTYSSKGELLKTVMDDGRVWEPVELAKLKRMWEQKGLSVDR